MVETAWRTNRFGEAATRFSVLPGDFLTIDFFTRVAAAFNSLPVAFLDFATFVFLLESEELFFILLHSDKV